MAISLSQINAKTRFFAKRSSNLRLPSIVAIAQNQFYWATIEEDIKVYINKVIPIRSPEMIFEPMRHITFAAPRTTAPALCVAACEAVGGDRSQAMAAASAIHLMYAAAYAHENLPLTDRPRPKPTIKHKYNPNIELLTGDGIIPFGLELLARSVDLTQSNQDKILRVIIEITRATGSQGTLDGQYHELSLDQLGTDFESIEYVSKKKEGALHACGAACGAILGGGVEEEIEKLRNFGLYAGMIHGMLRINEPGLEEKITKLAALALKELESFQRKKIELISSLVEHNLGAVVQI